MIYSTKNINIYFSLFIFCFYFIGYIELETDFDYHRLKRLNNGNYLIMSTQGIYIYNEQFNSKINLTLFKSRLVESHDELYSSDIEQFPTENNGYIICLIKNETFFLSKKGVLLQNKTLDYIQYFCSYNIIPIGQSGNGYYYAIISIENDKIYIRNYIYNSSNNDINLDDIYFYNITTKNVYNKITCELMNYNNEKVITCFFGNWEKTFYSIYSASNFSLIKQNCVTNIYPKINGGQNFVSTIIPPLNKEMACCFMHEGDYKCFIFNIEKNIIDHIQTIADDSNSRCDLEIIDMIVEYFPETEEIIVGCQNINTKNSFYLGKYTSNYSFINYGLMEIAIPEKCYLDIFHLIYSSSNKKYSIVADIDCINERVFPLNNISSLKINDYPADETGFLFCDYFYSYDKIECLDEIPPGFYCNSTIDKTIDKCHDNCETCDKGPREENNNCLTCKNNLFLNLGNCVEQSECSNGYFNDSSIMKCKCTSNNACLLCDSENQLCRNCNTELNFYPKKEDIEKNNKRRRLFFKQ